MPNFPTTQHPDDGPGTFALPIAQSDPRHAPSLGERKSGDRTSKAAILLTLQAASSIVHRARTPSYRQAA
jgi:hypothetical protein